LVAQDHNTIPAIISENDTPCDIIDSDPESDCGYDGGVNCDWSDSNSEYEDYTDTDLESLEEINADELDDNLHELRAELDDLVTPTKYDQIMDQKLTMDWTKAEQNRHFGYSGNSKRTREWRAKEARCLMQRHKLCECSYSEICVNNGQSVSTETMLKSQ
jgi:hypothetical protein